MSAGKFKDIKKGTGFWSPLCSSPLMITNELFMRTNQLQPIGQKVQKLLISFQFFYDTYSIVRNTLLGLMARTENDLDIYFAVGNANTSRQENEIGEIIKKRNSLGWKLVSTSTALVDMSKQFSNLYLFWEKQNE
tara:strand:- start:1207 stop:1611 length:405 start_codon:yes stop_codon:yes gene_type:complete